MTIHKCIAQFVLLHWAAIAVVLTAGCNFDSPDTSIEANSHGQDDGQAEDGAATSGATLRKQSGVAKQDQQVALADANGKDDTSKK